MLREEVLNSMETSLSGDIKALREFIEKEILEELRDLKDLNGCSVRPVSASQTLSRRVSDVSIIDASQPDVAVGCAERAAAAATARSAGSSVRSSLSNMRAEQRGMELFLEEVAVSMDEELSAEFVLTPAAEQRSMADVGMECLANTLPGDSVNGSLDSPSVCESRSETYSVRGLDDRDPTVWNLSKLKRATFDTDRPSRKSLPL